MAEIRANQVMAILQASGELSSELIEKISNLVLTDPNIPLLDNLVHSQVLTPESSRAIQELLNSLHQQFSTKSDAQQQILIQNLDKVSSITLSDEMKKDILFARQVLAEGTCKVDDVNRCFEEQATIRRSSNKTLLIGQIMVRNHYIPVDRFIQIHRDIEQQVKNTDWSKVFIGERRVRLTFQGGVIRFVEGNIPQKFGPYQILAEVARGGMGVVYKAWDDKLRRTVALKVLKDWENPPQDEVRRFNREARLAASLHHPNIVSIYDTGVTDGVHYFTMDFVEGQTISSYLKGNRRNFHQEITMIREIALALAYAHSHGIIHRDVKPANIILDANNTPMLTDFGLAKGLNQFDSRRLTKSGEALGTPAYMSPEQAQNSDSIDGRSDIYSLGAVLYEILVGQPPAPQNPIPPATLNPKIHKHIETICLKALAPNPNDRYQNAKEFADDLDRFLYGQNIKARPVSRWERLVQKMQRHIRFVLPLLLLLFSFFLTLSWVGYKAYFSSQEANQNYEQAMILLNANQPEKAYQYFMTAAKHPPMYDKVAQKLNELGTMQAGLGEELLANYRREKPRLMELYEKELRRFRITQDSSLKQEALKAIQDLRILQHKNFQQLVLAYRRFQQALIWQPANPKLWNFLEDLHQEVYYDCSIPDQTWLPPLKMEETQKSGMIKITTYPDKAQVYIFALGELYLRRVPVPQFLANTFLFQGELIPQIEQSYLERTHPDLTIPNLNAIEVSNTQNASLPLTSSSYVTDTPGTIPIQYPGYYLIIIVKNGYQEIRRIIKITKDQQYDLQIHLLPTQPELKGFFSVHIEDNQLECNNYVSSEITGLQYQQFLQDPNIFAKYKTLSPRGTLRYVPRIGNRVLWTLNGQNFVSPNPNSPVVGISWQDAQEYCQWLSSKSQAKISYRLLTPQEWQLLAGQVTGLRYPWGQVFDPWFTTVRDPKTGLHFDVSPYGLPRMAGGVSEWCNDSYKAGPLGSLTIMASVCGGASNNLTSETARTDFIEYRNSASTAENIGFRIIASVEIPKKQ